MHESDDTCITCMAANTLVNTCKFLICLPRSEPRKLDNPLRPGHFYRRLGLGAGLSVMGLVVMGLRKGTEEEITSFLWEPACVRTDLC